MKDREPLAVKLEPFGASHVTDSYLAWMNDPDVTRYLSTWNRRYSLQDLRTFAAAVTRDPRSHFFAITVGQGHHIGNIKLRLDQHQCADIGILIGDKAYWGRGCAKQAVSQLVTYGFSELGLEKLTAGAAAPNLPSAKLFLSCGFRLEGIRRLHWRLEAGRCDYLEFGLNNEAFGR